MRPPGTSIELRARSLRRAGERGKGASMVIAVLRTPRTGVRYGADRVRRSAGPGGELDRDQPYPRRGLPGRLPRCRQV